MAYNKNTWATDDIITADKLNNLETGIANSVDGVSISNGTDFNALKSNGRYFGSGIFPNSPAPTTSWQWLIDVSKSVTFVSQRAIQLTASTPNVFFRNLVGGTWQAWQKQASYSDVVKLTGDQTVTGNKSFTGQTTIAGKGMTDSGWLNIPLNSGATAVYAKYRILFGVVYVHVQQISGKAVFTPYFTLPDGIRPPDTIFQTWFSGGKFGNNQLQPDGQFMCTSGSSDASTQVSFYTQYPI